MLVAGGAVYPRTPADNHYFIAAVTGVHNRYGFIDFGNDRTEYVRRNILWSLGVSGGRNFALKYGLRLALPMQFEYGKAIEDTVADLTLVDGTNPPLELHSLMYHLGVEPIFQLPFRLASALWMYAALGGGVHYTTLKEELRIIDDPRRRRVEGDSRLEEGGVAGFSIAAGSGIEIALSPTSGVFVNYIFRFWQPVNRMTHRDLFPLYARPYKERFFSNTVSLGILFAKDR